jgi:hypothetical protein
MPTPLTHKPLVRVAPGTRLTNYRNIVVKLTDTGVYFREQGRRTWFGPLPWDSLYFKAARAEADRIAREKRAERAARRKARNANR